MKILEAYHDFDHAIINTLSQDELEDINGGWCLINGIFCGSNQALLPKENIDPISMNANNSLTHFT